MSEEFSMEPMLDVYIYETTQLIEQLEQIVLNSEQCKCYTEDTVNEIFRIMHTIKGSSAMMLFENISKLSHCIEDLFFFIREEKVDNIEYDELSDLLLNAIDFIKVELEKIKNGDETDGDADRLIENIENFLTVLKSENSVDEIAKQKSAVDNEKTQYYIPKSKEEIIEAEGNKFKAVIHFEEDCEMENVRAFSVIHDLKDICKVSSYIPGDIDGNSDSINVIREHGFTVFFETTKSYEEIEGVLNETIFLKKLELEQLNSDDVNKESLQKSIAVEETASTVKCENKEEIHNKSSDKIEKIEKKVNNSYKAQSSLTQSIISVNVLKLDKLMDLVGELVISQAMVTENSDLKGLELQNFHKSARQLRKVTNELQDTIMSIRMVPLDTTFNKMHRIVRDMNKKLNKEVELEIKGEETEVDKNIIEHISDPLMHLIRNAVDHGIEDIEERQRNGKVEVPKVTLEAKNSGGNVLVMVKDNGRGLDKDKILEKARENNLIRIPEDKLTNKEIYNFITLPGFSTNDEVSEFSGRGVGMDVVTKNIETIGGSIIIDSTPGAGTVITLKIPLTLAIIDGMNVKVGDSKYTIPITSIKESFKAKEENIITDSEKNEMIMVRGQCYPILRLHKLYKVQNSIKNISEGIMLMVENDINSFCIFADKLIGEQQVVVKALPDYIKNFKKVKGLSGCTLLGDGSISLILDVAALSRKEK